MEFNNSTYLVATKNCEIVETRSNKSKMIMNGYSNNEIKGTIHLSLGLDLDKICFYTCGEDGVLARWCNQTNKLLNKTKLNF